MKRDFANIYYLDSGDELIIIKRKKYYNVVQKSEGWATVFNTSDRDTAIDYCEQICDKEVLPL